ncbi:MAG: DUF4440 domain-containing protein [Planctomycetaceae bacterium]
MNRFTLTCFPSDPLNVTWWEPLTMVRRRLVMHLLLAFFVVVAWSGYAMAQEGGSAIEQEVKASIDQFTKLFNEGKAEELVKTFSAQGELIDEEGDIFQGHDALLGLFKTFFEKFPGAKLDLEVESLRLLGGSLAIEEGTRRVSSKDDSAKAQLKYVTIRTKTESGWKIASIREFSDDAPATPHERLQPLAWLVGEWVNEGADAVVKISYRWSEDKNFLLGEFQIQNKDSKAITKNSHRIGWDPVTQKVRSWLFDADGGFSEGSWTPVEEGWMVKSTSVIADGRTGSATLTWIPRDAEHFTIRGTDRIVGDDREADFEISVGKRPRASTSDEGSGKADATKKGK